MLQLGSMPVESFIQEARMMHQLSHPNIVQILGVVTRGGGPTLLISEYMEKGSLNSYLKANRGALSPTFFLFAASDDVCSENKIQSCRVVSTFLLIYFSQHSQVAAGCEYLEKKSVVHCDLRTANVLLDEDLIAKVADFGMAGFREHLTNDMSPLPMRWTAPEAYNLRQFSSKSDVFSFSVLLWELVTYGASPYAEIAENLHAFHKVCGGLRMRNPAGEGLATWCPKKLYELMAECWNMNAVDRPAFGDIKNRLNHLLSQMLYGKDCSADRDFASDGARGK